MPYRFRLLLPDGGEPELDEFVTAASDWRPGDELMTTDQRGWRVVDVVPTEPGEGRAVFDGFLVVEPLE